MLYLACDARRALLDHCLFRQSADLNRALSPLIFFHLLFIERSTLSHLSCTRDNHHISHSPSTFFLSEHWSVHCLQFDLHAKIYTILASAGQHSYIMHHLSLAPLLAIIFFLGIISGAPTELERRSFKVHQKRYDLATTRSGAAAMGRAYRKFGFPVPGAMPANRLGRRRICNTTIDGENTLHRSPAVSKVAASAQEADAEFLSPITIGGAQTVNLDFDTGSADT